MTARKTVLIVDDEADIREIEEILLKRGFNIIGTASDGHQAIDLVRAHQPDLVVLDYGLPGLSGLDVGTQIRNESANSRILVFSGLPEAERAMGPHWGDEFLRKTDVAQLPEVAERLVTGT